MKKKLDIHKNLHEFWVLDWMELIFKAEILLDSQLLNFYLKIKTLLEGTTDQLVTEVDLGGDQSSQAAPVGVSPYGDQLSPYSDSGAVMHI